MLGLAESVSPLFVRAMFCSVAASGIDRCSPVAQNEVAVITCPRWLTTDCGNTQNCTPPGYWGYTRRTDLRADYERTGRCPEVSR